MNSGGFTLSYYKSKKKKFMDLIGFEIFKIKQFNFYFDGKH